MAGMYQTLNAGPVPISDEYELALLAQIGDAYLSLTEIVYVRIPEERVDVLRICSFDANGNPLTIIHDFNLRDDRSPYGQGYQENLTGPLSAASPSTINSLNLQSLSRTGWVVTLKTAVPLFPAISDGFVPGAEATLDTGDGAWDGPMENHIDFRRVSSGSWVVCYMGATGTERNRPIIRNLVCHEATQRTYVCICARPTLLAHHGRRGNGWESLPHVSARSRGCWRIALHRRSAGACLLWPGTQCREIPRMVRRPQRTVVCQQEIEYFGGLGYSIRRDEHGATLRRAARRIPRGRRKQPLLGKSRYAGNDSRFGAFEVAALYPGGCSQPASARSTRHVRARVVSVAAIGHCETSMKSMVKSMAGTQGNVLEKQQVSNQQRVRGVPGLPESPRDVQVQSAAGGVMVTWKLPTNHDRVSGWRVYINNENNLAMQVRDKGTRQAFIPLSSNSSPSPVNVMVSSVTTLGRESGKVVVQGTPHTQSTTTTVPSVPPGYSAEGPGGADRGLIRFKGEVQYVHS